MYDVVRDFLKAAAASLGEAWGHPNYMVTRPVSLKAMLRVCADLARADEMPAEGRVQRWQDRLEPWQEQVRQFRSEGFYERFPAKGQVERTSRIHKELSRIADIETGRPKSEAKRAAS